LSLDSELASCILLCRKAAALAFEQKPPIGDVPIR
jgi:hypothetical protein